MMHRPDGTVRLGFFIALFFVGFVYCMSGGFVSSAQSLEQLQRNVDNARDRLNSHVVQLGVLEARVNQNSADIERLIISNAELVASVNRFTGIGIGLGALGGVIVILQTFNLVKKGRNGN